MKLPLFPTYDAMAPARSFRRRLAWRWSSLLLAAALLGACTSTPLPPWPATPAEKAASPEPAPAAPAPLGTAEPDAGATTAPMETTAPTASEPPAPLAESPAVAALFPDPPVRYDTPGLTPQRRAYTTNAELSQWLATLANTRQQGTRIQLLDLGRSQQGTSIQALAFSQGGTRSARGLDANGRPTVVLIGQQHGDEPASSEALLVIARELAQGLLEPMLRRINVVVVPRANPDGAAAGTRATADGTDLAHDHLVLRTPEAAALAQLVRSVRPVAVIDVREYPATAITAGPADALPRYDILLQHTTAANVPEFITKAAQEWYLQPMLKTLDSAGLTHEWYHTLQAGPDGPRAAMGDAVPDSVRNIAGLQNAVGLLVASRGVGIERAHLQRRVHSLVLALTSALRSTDERANSLLQVQSFVARDTAAQACRGSLVARASPTASQRELRMLDPTTAQERTVTLSWDSTLRLRAPQERPRPCGYWLAADASDAVQRLLLLGLQVMRVAEPGSVLADTGGAGAGTTARTAIDAPADSYYVSMGQPLAYLAAAALEPDTPFGYAAAGLLPRPQASARVMSAPALVFDEPE